jgi:hypothetical protein
MTREQDEEMLMASWRNIPEPPIQILLPFTRAQIIAMPPEQLRMLLRKGKEYETAVNQILAERIWSVLGQAKKWINAGKKFKSKNAVKECMKNYKEASIEKQADGSFAVHFQVTDAAGNSVGSPTVLTGATEAEVTKKLINSYANAAQAVARLRDYKIQKQNETYGTVPEELQKTLGERIALQFQSRHNDPRDLENFFFACQANSNVMGETLREEGLPWTLESLETVFELLRGTGRLAQSNAPVAPATVVPAAILPAAEVIPEAKVRPWSHVKTPADVKAIDRDQFGLWFRHYQLGPEFRAYIDAILQGRA